MIKYIVKSRKYGNKVQVFDTQEKALKAFKDVKNYNSIIKIVEEIKGYLVEKKNDFIVIYHTNGNYIYKAKSIEDIEDTIEQIKIDWDIFNIKL